MFVNVEYYFLLVYLDVDLVYIHGYIFNSDFFIY